MSEKSYWFVKRDQHDKEWALITCPHCMEWYQVLNRPGELECYRHCPWCGKPLFLKEEDKHGAK